LKNGKSEILLSKSFGDSKIIEYPLHLAETTPHKNTPLQNWDTLSQEQTTKLTEESQKTKQTKKKTKKNKKKKKINKQINK
jgi:hypothetical protein